MVGAQISGLVRNYFRPMLRSVIGVLSIVALAPVLAQRELHRAFDHDQRALLSGRRPAVAITFDRPRRVQLERDTDPRRLRAHRERRDRVGVRVEGRAPLGPRLPALTLGRCRLPGGTDKQHVSQCAKYQCRPAGGTYFSVTRTKVGQYSSALLMTGPHSKELVA